MDRVALSAEKYEQLFGSPPDATATADPNSIEVQIAAMIHRLPHVGFPRALNAIRVINHVAMSE